MAAVIRMKRHISEEPHSAFILNCKKRKTDDSKQGNSTSGETSTVLKFAGTVNQDTDITEHIAKITKEDAKDIVNRKKPDTSVNKRLEQNREKSQQNRFKIVNYTRALNEPKEEDSSPAPSANLTIVDVEKERTANNTATTSSAQVSSFSDISDEPFVYDIYIADSTSLTQYPDSIDLNDLRLVLLEEVYCSFYALM